MSADPAILIHGAWQGAWVWERLTPLLTERGIASVAVDLPGNGTDDVTSDDVSLERYVDHIGSILDGLGRPASLVGHSGGGAVASAVAERFPEQVSLIAYVAGMMLPSGMGFADLIAELIVDYPGAAGVGPHLIWSDDRRVSRVPPQAAHAYFFHDCAAEDAEAAARRLTPQPESGRALRAHLTSARFGRVPRLYVEAELDHAVILPAQRRMQELVPGAEVVTLPTGHAPHLAAPALLADTLVPFLAGSAPSGGHGTALAKQSPQPGRRRRAGGIG